MPDGTYQSIYHDISERKKAEKALKESEEWFRKLFEQSTDGIFYSSLEGEISAVNNKFAEIHGYTIDEMKRMNIKDLDCPEAIQLFSDRISRLLNGENLKFEVEHFHKDGHRIPLEVSAGMIRMGSENYIMGSHRDISESRKTELALRVSEEKFRSIAENISDVIFIANEEGNIQYISPASRSLGYIPEDCIGKYFGDFVAEGELDKAVIAFKNALDRINVGRSVSMIMKRNDGTNFFAELTSSFFMIGNEKPGVLGLLRDITSRKMLEDTTIESEKRYRELFLNNPIPTYIFDETTLEFVEVNDATVENYGYSREEFSKMTLKDIRLSDDIPALIASLEHLGKDVFYTTNMRHKKKNGQLFPVEITSHSLPEKNGRKTRLVLVSDTTERIKAADQMNLAREKAEASDRLKTTFLNNISHEVRTPLNGILGFAELISQENISNAEKNEALEMVYESSDRLLKTITNYMDISLLTSGSFSVNQQEIQILQYCLMVFTINTNQFVQTGR